MKGKLYKTDEGWVVRWLQEDPRDPLPELPLHPQHANIHKEYLQIEEEVEFDWCVIVQPDGKGKEYAKLLNN